MMKNKSKKVSLKKNALLNTIKQTCSIIFPLITIPYATRILGSVYYGKVNYAASIISYFSLLAGLGINNYGIRSGAHLRDNNKEFNDFCNELFSINLISTIFTYALLIIISNSVPLLRGYRAVLLILSIQILFTTIGTDWINTIFEDYLYISVRYILCTLAALVLMVVFVKKPADYLIYAFTSIASVIFANLANIPYIKRKYNVHIKFVLKLKLKKHLKPILILFCTSIASVIYLNSDITMLRNYTDESTVGFYSSSAKLHSFIVQFFNSVQMVFIPHISYAVSHGEKREVDKILNNLLGDLLLIILPATAGAVLLSKQIIVLFCGVEFESAYSSFAILNLALPFSVLSYFFYWVIMVPFEMEGKFMIATILSAVTNVALNIVLIPLWGQNATALTTLISEFIMFGLGIFYLHNRIKFNVLKEFFVGILGFVIVSIIVFSIGTLNYSNIEAIMLSIIVSIAIYLIILFIFEKKKTHEVIKQIRLLLHRNQR